MKETKKKNGLSLTDEQFEKIKKVIKFYSENSVYFKNLFFRL